jgi:short/branched chain acyl-CoA dehydrogenase
MWITNSGEAETFLVFANVDPSAGYKGITCFVVDKDMGVEIAKKEKKLGIRASSTCLLNFDDIKVPKENIVGEIGKGYKIAIEILNEGRIGIAAQMIGIAQGAFDKSLGYAYQRKQFGKAVGEFQGMAFQFSQIATEIEAARLLTYNAARLKEEGRVFTKEAAMAKLYASQVAQKASGAAIEWAGGVGFTRETGIEKVSLFSSTKLTAVLERFQDWCHLRRHKQHPTADDCKVPAKAVSVGDLGVASVGYNHVMRCLEKVGNGLCHAGLRLLIWTVGFVFGCS